MAIEILSQKDLVEFKQIFNELTLTASVELMGNDVKVISNGIITKNTMDGDSHVGTFRDEKNKGFYLNVQKEEELNSTFIELPIFLENIKNKILELYETK